jgi:thiol-disulfide isomerase/thioredoxin
MKKLLLVLLISIGLFSFKTIIDNNFTISGNATGVENGKKVLLQKQDETKGIVTIDSAKVVDGKFSFKGVATEPSIHFIELEKVQGKIALILENGKISVAVDKDSLQKSKIGGTQNNIELQNFNAAAMKVQSKMMAFQKANNEKMTAAQTKKDTVVINGLMKEFNKFQDEMIALTNGFPETHPKSFLSVLFVDNMFNAPEVDIQKIKKTYALLDASLKTTKAAKLVEKKIENFKSLAQGNEAPAFSAPNPEGKVVSLKESLGKVTIIDFWASWCGPCRKENPNVVSVYKDFHDKGLNIISVSLDKDGAKWKEAIAKDNLTWTHVSNLKFWEDPIAVLYNIKSIPATFILDEKGNIIARDLRGEELRTKISSLLNKK